MFQQLKLYITDVFYEIKNMFSELKIYITEDLYKIYPPLKIEIENKIKPKSITNTNHIYGISEYNRIKIDEISYYRRHCRSSRNQTEI